MPETTPPDHPNVLTWNVLLDKKRTAKGIIASRAQRLPSQVDTLRALELDTIDFAMI